MVYILRRLGVLSDSIDATPYDAVRPACRDARHVVETRGALLGAVLSWAMREQGTLRKRLAMLLREAERAHGEYEKTLGHRDDDWPDWYAAYIAERLEADSDSHGPS